MNLPFRVIGLFSVFLLCLFSGCEKNDRIPFLSEESDPNYSRGNQLRRQGRDQEALAAFLKVIATRGDNAPESHLTTAIIYQQHIKDPIAAIYHYRKYLELQPNSRTSDLVRQRIDSAKREFARSLPAHPMEDASIKMGFMDQLERLQRENDQLKSEISALRAGLPNSPAGPITRSTLDISQPLPSTAPLPRPVAVEPPPADSRPALGASLAAEQPVTRNRIDASGRPGSTPTVDSPALQRPQQTTVQAPAAKAVAKPATPPAAGKKHTVVHGDTLYSLSQRYYGTRTRWREIFQANRDQLKAESDRLRLGMELKIP